MKILFEKVAYTHRTKDANGKWKQKTFWQSINPFNKNADGTVKNREDILIDLKVRAKIWERSLK